MKPTEKQIEVIKEIESCVGYWASTNDIKSPSHYTLIEDSINEFRIDGVSKEKLTEICEKLHELYDIVKNI